MEKPLLPATPSSTLVTSKQTPPSTQEEMHRKKSSSEISMKQFLDFLRTAYQVTDTVEETLATAEGTADVIDWMKLKNTELVDKSVSCSSMEKVGDSANIKSKLDEILNEGLLDSVIPYLVPTNPSKTKASITKVSEKNSSSITRSSTNSSIGKKKSHESNLVKIIKTDSEVEIHVCDEVKNIKKDFICSQKLLVEKMGYFAEVTSGQKLEDMDISVHCDIGIFEWLMKWVKKEISPEEDWPKLDPSCVIPILVSAAFLQMEPLLQDCLFFCHQNLNEIIQTATNLNCLNDSIITRLAAMYTNSELEHIKDKKDKIQSRLYCKMIISLCDPLTESVRGHWNSLAHIYRCSKCEQLIMPEVATTLPCLPSCMAINSCIANETKNMAESLLALMGVGDCHFLYCTTCEKFFPVHKMRWCAYHPEHPQYFTVDSQKAPLPVGRYPCCGERAYRFQLLNNFTGCQFREHTPRRIKARDVAVLSILDNFREVIDTEPPELIFPERLTRLVARDPATSDGKLLCKEVFWWDGIQIIPPRSNLGLLGIVSPPSNKSPQHPHEDETETNTSDELSSSVESGSSASSHSEEEQTTHRCSAKQSLKKRKFVKKNPVGRLWQINLSARSNQDFQREHEEQVVSKMIHYLSKKTNLEMSNYRAKGFQRHITPSGGIYVRLEHEWRESNVPSVKKYYSNNRTKAKGNNRL